MYLDNVIGHSTSKSKDEILLKGEFVNTGRTLNGRVKLLHEDSSVVWVNTEIIEAAKTTSTLAEPEALESVQPSKHSTEPEHRPQDTTQEYYHIVKRGETLQSIASYYGIPEGELRAANIAHSFCIGARLRIKRGM